MLRELNKESFLLLYVADELSAEDRAQVDQMLAADPALRAELHRLSGALDSFESGMALLDARPLPAESALTRRIGSAMRQRIADRIVQSPPSVAAPRGLRFPRWGYPAAAALVLIGLVSYWGTRPDDSAKIAPLGQLTTIYKLPSVPGAPLATNHGEQAATPDETQVADMTDDFDFDNPTQPQKSVASLNVAERHLAELSRSRDQWNPSGLVINDGNE